jgi:transposase
MTDNRNLLKLTDEQRQELRRWAQSRTLPAGDVFRARLILALGNGTSYREIAKSLKTSGPTIARWKRRFEPHGMAGLEGRHQGSKPRSATPAVQARVIRRLQQKPGDGSTHWSCRKLANQLGLSKSTVQRILAQAQLKPHRLERYMASKDPDFEAKAADIIALYLHPPQHAAVFCVDEKTAIQALDRLDRQGGTARLRVLPPWNAIVICGFGSENRQGEGQDGEAAHERRVHRLSESVA